MTWCLIGYPSSECALLVSYGSPPRVQSRAVEAGALGYFFLLYNYLKNSNAFQFNVCCQILIYSTAVNIVMRNTESEVNQQLILKQLNKLRENYDLDRS